MDTEVPLILTGEFRQGRLVILWKGLEHRITPHVYSYLLELVVCRWMSNGGYLYIDETRTSAGNAVYTRQLVLRLRRICGKAFVENAAKGYRIGITADEIDVDDSVLELRDEIVDARIKAKLMACLLERRSSSP